MVTNSLKLHKLTYRNVLHTDSGLYECQVSTVPKLSRLFNLQIQGKYHNVYLHYN
jgi:hypothetical protein